MISLVQMPYCGLERPSISLSLLKAYLTPRGIESKIVYGNVDFASEVGLDIYRAFEETPCEHMIGEWTFARAAFPEAPADEQGFLALAGKPFEELSNFHLLSQRYPDLEGARLMSRMRELAPAFVDRMARKVLADRPRIVGCTSMFQQHCGSLALLRRIRELDPEVVTMIGGANCEGTMGEVAHRHFPWLDYVVSGEADAFFADLCQAILEKGRAVPREQLAEGVWGPAHRSPAPAPRTALTVLSHQAPAAGQRAVLHSLDDAAVPDYDEYFEALSASDLAVHVKPRLLFESSRGCWWGMKHHCTFCGLNGDGMTFRAKSGPRVLQEMVALRERYGIRWLSAVDNIIDMRHVKTLMPDLARLPEPPYLFYEVKANLKRDQLQVLRDGGVRRIQPGIESMHDDALKLLRKGNSWFINVQLLKWSQELGMQVLWNFLCGIPGESEDWYRELAEWLPALYHLEPPGEYMSTIRYDRFSPYHSSPQAFGLKLVPKKAYRYIYPLPPADLEDFAYFFDDEGGQPPVWGPAHDALQSRLHDWHRAFYGRNGRPPARLIASDLGDRVAIRDSRPGAAEGELVLTGLDYRVWKACDSAHSREDLLASLRNGTGAPSLAELLAATERLKAQRIVLEWRGRILSLPVNAPVIPYLTPAENYGYRSLRTLQAKGLSRSLIDASRRPPGTPASEKATAGG
jgi:ribosomal peptide maturation radical SAM protein 1